MSRIAVSRQLLIGVSLCSLFGLITPPSAVSANSSVADQSDSNEYIIAEIVDSASSPADLKSPADLPGSNSNTKLRLEHLQWEQRKKSREGKVGEGSVHAVEPTGSDASDTSVVSEPAEK